MAETYSTKPMIERTAEQEAAIRGAWDQLKNDPMAVNVALRDNNISASDLASIAGIDANRLNSYLGSAGTYGGLGGMPPGWDQYSQASTGSAGQPSSPFVTGGGGGGGGGYSAGGTASMSGQNPYLPQLGALMTQQMTDNFARRIAPAIGSQAMAAGGYGGSRQGVLEANAMNDLNQQIAGGLANLYGQGYGQDLNYNLGVKNNDLGWGNLGLGYSNLDRNINNDNLNWQLQGAQFGMGLYDRLQQGNQTGINAGTNIQNTPMNYWSQFGNQYNSIGQGYGTTTGNTSQQGNPLMGALGGAQLGNQFGNWWNSSQNAPGGANSQGWGTGSGYGNQDFGSYF